MPNKTSIQATHTCYLTIPGLPSAACQAHIFPQLAHALLPIGQLCNHGCTATFTADAVSVHCNGSILLTGYSDPGTRLWKIPMNSTTVAPPTSPSPMQPKPHRALSAYHTSTQPDLIAFLHAAAGYPVPSTWIKAIDKGHYSTRPALLRKQSENICPSPWPPLRVISISNEKTSDPPKPSQYSTSN
jgi:hypothetical protein